VFVGWGVVDSNCTWFAAEWLGMDFGCVAVDCMKMILGGMMENKTMCGIVCCFLNAVTSTKCVAWLRRMTGKAGNLALFFGVFATFQLCDFIGLLCFMGFIGLV